MPLIRKSLSTRFAISAAALAIGWSFSTPSFSGVPLADQPIFSATNVPGNLALVLSVEFPTAVSVAHPNRTYAAANEYLGYFDPNKCYIYRLTDGTGNDNYFYPSNAAVSRVCNGRWSGNFLNWATMQTIDPFRWALTGGYRVTDTASLTVIEKAWATGQGGTGNFPDAVIPSSAIAGATPFGSSWTTLNMRVQGLGNKMRFLAPTGIPFAAKFWNNQTQAGNPVLTRTDTSISFNWDATSPDGSVLVNRENMSAQWKGSIYYPTAGSYQFRMRADDTVKLMVGAATAINQTSYDNLQNKLSPVYVRAAGSSDNIQVDFTQAFGLSSVVLEWLTPGATAWVPVTVNAGNLYSATATPYDSAAAISATVPYEVFIRAKVCDSAIGLESNCKQYGTNFKPEGLMQQYANKIRYSAFGYLNDSSILRDGGVLRARQKFIGPTVPVPGSSAITNTGSEWNAATGVFSLNPDAVDASNTAAIMGLPAGTVVSNSGAMNYVNKFGQLTPGSYKTYDNVSELYYAAVRYFKNLPNVPEWSSVTGASNANRILWTDGFPVITAPADPILYSCQRNFILGIGDVNTHADKNLPGRVLSNSEPSLPPMVSADTTVDATVATDKVGALEGLGNIGTVGTNGTRGLGIVGLAYDSHTKDIRPDIVGQANTTGIQTIDTYWVDVQEYQSYLPSNQFYLATKYGGFTVPNGYSTYGNNTALPLSSWSTNGQKISGQDRPDNYFLGGQPNTMRAGLASAFSRISEAISAYTTSFSTSLPQVAQSGNSSFSSKYDPNNWTGEISASNLAFDITTGEPSLTPTWSFTDKLATQLASAGWNTGRRVVTFNGTAGVAFRPATVAAADLTALDTAYVSGNDAANFINYVRGERANEASSSVTGSTRAYRDRTRLLGDIVGSKARPIGPPSFPFSEANNPGYTAFKTLWASRRTVVYAGSNDGMMHAVNGALVTTATPGIESDTAAGTEMFAYVPRSVIRGPSGTPSVDGLASTGNPTFSHRYMVNATPTVADVDFSKTSGATGAPDWRSVLIGGLGKGGKSYYAINVTDPVSMVSGGETAVAANVLWEFSDSDLGFTFGDPSVVKTRKWGWVAIFGSGYGNADGKGYFLIVNPKTGALLEKIGTGEGSVASEAGLAHLNAFVIDSSDGTADAIYAGDLLGNLWRLNVSATTGAYPAPVKIASLADASGAVQPITSRPAIEVHPSLKKRFVLVATGRLLDQSDIASTQRQSFYAITDGTNANFNAAPPSPLAFPIRRAALAPNPNALVGVTFDPASQMGWYEDIGSDAASGSAAWRMVNELTTLSGSVAFASILPNGNACSPAGDSRVYARDYAAASTTVKIATNNAVSPALFVPQTGSVTDLRYLSVRGKPTLISGTDTGSVRKIEINPVGGLTMRRLNWRELQIVN